MVRILENEIYDITIVGAGPVGLFTATYALMRQAKTQVIESLSEVGGQVTALFPAKQIYDIPGYFKISGTDLISNLKEQTDFFKPEIHLNETVEKFEKDGGTDLRFGNERDSGFAGFSYLCPERSGDRGVCKRRFPPNVAPHPLSLKA